MMSDKKAVFFDADGTICDIEKGVPDSAIESIKKLIANGHQAWLCTGRSRAFVPWYLERIPFTGMISACGATIEKDGKRLYNNEMTPEVAEKSVEILRKYGLIPVMEGADYMYYDKDEYTTEVNWYADLITEALGPKWRPIRGNEHCMHINKISAKMQDGCDADQACRELSPYYDVIHHENNAFVPCLNMRLQKLLWVMVRLKSGNWQIMLQQICSTMEFKTGLQNLDLSEQCKYSVQ